MKNKNKIIVSFLTLICALSFSEEEKNNIVLNITEINVNTTTEKTGLEIGNNAYARGENSISTGRNSIAIGKSAVATGGNETLESIRAKISENEAKLKEITLKKEEIAKLTKELEDLKLREKETIEAGIRVKEIAKSKENLKLKWQNATQDYNNYVAESKSKIDDYNSKIYDLNSRLSALATINGLNLNSEEGLNDAAKKLKAKVEENTTLNLSEEFYKEYAKNYYKALGELRENEKIISKFSETNFNNNYNLNLQNVKHYYTDLYNFDYINYTNNFLTVDKNGDIFTLQFYSNGRINLRNLDNTLPILNYYNKDTDIVTYDEYNKYITYENKFKEVIKNYISDCEDITLTPEVKNKFIYKLNLKYDMWKKSAEICYYQGEYERTKDTTWLDKKKVALNEYNSMDLEFKKLPEIKNLRNKELEKFKKENITDVKEKNKITVEKLTSELEVALGINKAEIQNIENQKTQLKNLADSYYNQYNNLNPTEKDLILSREYERVSQLLQDKATNLETQVVRLKELQDGLTLHDLTNIGENAIAIGNETISSGTNAIAFGKGNIATKENSVAIGTDNLVNAKDSIGLGKGNVLSGEKTIAIGVENVVKGTGSGVFGDPNYVYGDNNYVVGNNNKVGVDGTPKNNVFILGSNVDASNVSNAIVLGNNSQAVENALSIGSVGNERKIVNVSKGTESTDAINLSQLKELQKATGLTDDEISKMNDASIPNENKPKTIIERITEIKKQIANNTTTDTSTTNSINEEFINNLKKEILKLQKDSNEKLEKKIQTSTSGVSNAIATASLPQVSSNKLFAFSAGTGYYEKHFSAAIGFSGQTKQKNLVYKFNISLNDKLKVGVGFGINYSFGDIAENEIKSNTIDGNLLNMFDENSKLISQLKKENEELKNMINTLSNDIKEIKNNNINKVKKDNYIVNNFEFNKYKLSSEQKEIISILVKNKDLNSKITVIGFTDLSGNEKYNLKLGLQRAKAVKQYLIELGFNENNIEESSYGYNKIDNKKDSELRKVEIIFE